MRIVDRRPCCSRLVLAILIVGCGPAPGCGDQAESAKKLSRRATEDIYDALSITIPGLEPMRSKGLTNFPVVEANSRGWQGDQLQTLSLMTGVWDAHGTKTDSTREVLNTLISLENVREEFLKSRGYHAVSGYVFGDGGDSDNFVSVEFTQASGPLGGSRSFSVSSASKRIWQWRAYVANDRPACVLSRLEFDVPHNEISQELQGFDGTTVSMKYPTSSGTFEQRIMEK